MKPTRINIVKYWYEDHFLLNLLKPLSIIFMIATRWRRQWLQRQNRHLHFKVPIIIVGNLTVGGSGKTPFVIWLATMLKQQGYKPGIISRGYGGHAKDYPLSITLVSSAANVGDEPLLIHKHTQCPVVVDPNRTRAVQYLLAQHRCDVVISDDGLQHYRLPRDMEIVVIDGDRRFGNGWCLPAGPLREPVSRLKQADYVVCNGIGQGTEASMTLAPLELIHVKYPEKRYSLQELDGQICYAVAGIGNPQRFFSLLQRFGVKIKPRPFADHYLYQPQDLHELLDKMVVMTEKDAVKCKDFAGENWWYLPVQATLPEAFAETLVRKLKHIITLKAYSAEGESHG